MGSAREWIQSDESAKEMLRRVLTERPLLLLSPLHRVPLRVGNIVEIVGPSPSAKTSILIQAAINCILPKDWNGVHYGGLEHLVMFFDLDCRFDILRLSQLLKHRLIEANRTRNNVAPVQNKADIFNSKETQNGFDEELFSVCMRRFLYVRCYNSFEFLAALKILHHRLDKERKAHGCGVRLIMIDSIGAFYWIDRASSFLPQGGPNRKSISFQNLSEAVVQEIKKLLLVHPMLVLATKTANVVDKYTVNHVKRSFRSWSSKAASDVRNDEGGPSTITYRENMPSVWQSFVTHRILVQPSGLDADDDRKHQNQTTYLSEWLLPALNLSDKFTVTDWDIMSNGGPVESIAKLGKRTGSRECCLYPNNEIEGEHVDTPRQLQKQL